MVLMLTEPILSKTYLKLCFTANPLFRRNNSHACGKKNKIVIVDKKRKAYAAKDWELYVGILIMFGVATCFQAERKDDSFLSALTKKA